MSDHGVDGLNNAFGRKENIARDPLGHEFPTLDRNSNPLFLIDEKNAGTFLGRRPGSTGAGRASSDHGDIVELRQKAFNHGNTPKPF
jgi:hypothetical protein